MGVAKVCNVSVFSQWDDNLWWVDALFDLKNRDPTKSNLHKTLLREFIRASFSWHEGDFWGPQKNSCVAGKYYKTISKEFVLHIQKYNVQIQD